MRLWSTLVSHSRHRYGHQPLTATSASTARMTMRTTAMLMRGSGSLNGIAAQVSFPNILTSCLKRRRTPRPADSRLSRARRCLVEDALEQLGLGGAIGCGRHGLARLCKLGVAGLVQDGSGAARLR